MKKLLLFLFLLITAFCGNAQDTLLNKYTKPNNTFGTILNRVYTPFALTPALDTLADAPQGSIAFKNHLMFFKDTTWKIWTGGGGGFSYSNGWGMRLTGNTFSVDTSLVPTIWYAGNTFYTKSQVAAFFSGVSPASGYNKSNWDNVYAAWGAVQALSPAGWATQSALVDSAAALRAIISSSGTGDMMKSIYDANNNGIVDVLELTGVVVGNGSSTPASIAGTANQLLRRNAGNTAYEFFTPSYLTTAITSLNGLSGTTQTLAIDTTYTGAASWSSVGTAHTLRLPARLFIPFDTTTIYSNLALKLNKSDTASMLSPYLRKVDTTSLSARINLKLNISDTTNKWVGSIYKRVDSFFYKKGVTETFIGKDSGSGNVNSASQYNWAYYPNNGTIVSGLSVNPNVVVGTDANGLPTSSGVSVTQIQDIVFTNQYFTNSGTGLSILNNVNDSTLGFSTFNASDFDLGSDSVISIDASLKASWNGKQAAITLTTTGTSGAATLVGSTLNIPQYSGGGGFTDAGYSDWNNKMKALVKDTTTDLYYHTAATSVDMANMHNGYYPQWDSVAGRFVGAIGTAFTNSGRATSFANKAVMLYDTSSLQYVWSDFSLMKLTGRADNDMVIDSSGYYVNRTPAQIKSILSLNNVENIPLSTWAGTTNITTLGTIGTGIWQGSVIGSAYLPSTIVYNTGSYGDPSWITSLSGTKVLPSYTGNDGKVLGLVSGALSWVTSGSGGVTLGTDNQIPFTNAGGTDFEYSSNLIYDGTGLVLKATGVTTNKLFDVQYNDGVSVFSVREQGALYTAPMVDVDGKGQVNVRAFVVRNMGGGIGGVSFAFSDYKNISLEVSGSLQTSTPTWASTNNSQAWFVNDEAYDNPEASFTFLNAGRTTTKTSLLIKGQDAQIGKLLDVQKNVGGIFSSVFNVTSTQTEAVGTLKVGSISQDDTEAKVVVWNSTDKVLEWRDATTLGGSGAVSSVFGRTGAVVAASGDYTASQVTNAVDQTGSYANPAWITSLSGTKVLPSYTGNDGKVLGLVSGALSWVTSGGGGVTLGTDNQIPFTNAGGTGFEYSSNLIYDGITLSASKINASNTAGGYYIGGVQRMYDLDGFFTRILPNKGYLQLYNGTDNVDVQIFDATGTNALSLSQNPSQAEIKSTTAGTLVIQGGAGATQIGGTLKVGSISQDDTEAKVVVWNSTDKVLEWRDATTISGDVSGATNITPTFNTSIFGGFFSNKTVNNLNFRSLSSPVDGGVSITQLTDEVEVKDNAFDVKGRVQYYSSEDTIEVKAIILPSTCAGIVTVYFSAIDASYGAYTVEKKISFSKLAGTLTLGTPVVSKAGETIGGMAVPASGFRILANNLRIYVGDGDPGTVNNIYWNVSYEMSYVVPNL